jgi:hypothetical protein
LFIAFGVMTAMWFRLRAELYMHKRAYVTELMTAYCEGKMKVVETDDGFNFETSLVMSEAKWLTLAYVLAMVVLVLDIFYWRAG